MFTEAESYNTSAYLHIRNRKKKALMFQINMEGSLHINFNINKR